MADESKTFGQGAGVNMYVQPLSRIGFGTNWYNGGSMLRSAISITVKMTRTYNYVSHTLLFAESDFNE